MSQALLEELAHAVAARLGETAGVAVVIDLPERRVRVSEHGVMREVYLGNAYEEYVHASPAERAAIVARYAGIVDGDVAPPTDAEWQTVLPKLVPRRERALLELRFGTATNMTAGIEVAGGLLLDLAIDLPERIRMVSAADLASANLTEAEAFERARTNLALRSREPWTRLADGLFQSPWGDYFDGARLALPTLFTRLGVQGDPVVTIPNRCAVLVSGSRETLGLRLLFEMTRMLVGQERPLHPGGLRLINGGMWRPLGDADTDLYAQAPYLTFLGSLQDALDYEAVGGYLREQIAAHGYHVTPLQVTELQGIRMTVATLPRDAGSIVIPKADLVMCGDGMFAWYKLEAMLGRNLVPIDVWPAHYEVRRVPTLVEIAAARIK